VTQTDRLRVRSSAGFAGALRPGGGLLIAFLALGIATIVAVPVLIVLSSLARPAGEIWVHLWRTQLPQLIVNTLMLVAGVGAGTLVVGTTLAWLVTTYRFPGRALFEWAFVLPLAVPAYVIGFTFLGLLEYSGPVQTALRNAFGAGLRLPDPQSYWGVVVVMTLVFSPYVYLLARAAFREQGAATLETARALGRSQRGAFVAVALPMARPSLVAGMSLAMMEALADFGTVATFGYRTLTEAIYRVWYGMFERAAATQLASLLLLFALGVLLFERAWRGHARFTQTSRRGPGPTPSRLRGWRAILATTAATTYLMLAFLIPVGRLALWAAEAIAAGGALRGFGGLVTHTLVLAFVTSGLACLLAIGLAYVARLRPSRPIRLSGQLASMGYALPGSVVAVGVLTALAGIDHVVAMLAAEVAGVRTDLLLTGSAVGLVYAYLVRFLAVSLQTVDASLTKIPPHLDAAARSLGATAGRVLRRVHLPLVRHGVLTALVLVFVETMKEMPATLLLRPFGRDTLAIEVWERTSESMWAEAAVPALAIVAAGLLPVVVAIRLGGRWTSRVQ
jgi:iron(III) transport system permease protein